MMLPELSPRELADRLKGPNPPVVVDVREPVEHNICRIEGTLLKPLGGIMAWAKDLDPQADTVLMCHTGYRSAQAAMYLRQLGFKSVFNLRGGIDAWSVQVDKTVRRY